MKNIAVFASGRGTNFSAIAKAVKRGTLKANLALLVCDNPQALVLEKAKRSGVKIALIKREGFAKKKDFESKIIEALKANKIDLIVLAGFMRILSVDFVKEHAGRIINIHPSLLPSFKGSQGIRDAFDCGVKVTGVTVHFVDELMDHGPIILQAPVKIEYDDTLASLDEKIHRVEHSLYPAAIKLFVEDKLRIEARRVKISAR
ncbi:MAG: phosphoribosylglycinamide formyltransferase [Candidatus Omnitrophota bacterium]